MLTTNFETIDIFCAQGQLKYFGICFVKVEKNLTIEFFVLFLDGWPLFDGVFN